ncbi:hypothetical protein BACEGG_00093 [Bacteroides eggerthii DSM 20697]|nr:hypothetical protein BACEGG_00093 [Bacteroides eggerthii DSM 20697]
MCEKTSALHFLHRVHFFASQACFRKVPFYNSKVLFHNPEVEL